MPDAKYTTTEELAHPNPATADKEGRQWYSTSKLVNVMWTYALHRRFSRLQSQGKSWAVVVIDPGLMPGTGLAREYDAFMRWLWKNVLPRVVSLLWVLVSPKIHWTKENGPALARLAIGEDVEGVSVVYSEGRRQVKSSVDSYDEKKQEALWVTLAHVVGSSHTCCLPNFAYLGTESSRLYLVILRLMLRASFRLNAISRWFLL